MLILIKWNLQSTIRKTVTGGEGHLVSLIFWQFAVIFTATLL